MNKKYVKAAVAIVIAVVAVAALAAAALDRAGGQLDVITDRSISSFDAVLAAAPGLTAGDAAGWALAAPDQSARLMWSADGAAVEFDAAPFADAGLDVAALPADYAAEDGRLRVGDAGGDAGDSPIEAYRRFARGHASAIQYHGEMDHFGIGVGPAVFEWAQNLARVGEHGGDQQKDIVFALDAQPLIAAGVDPEKVEGWVYGQVAVEADGRMAQAYKFLKPFNLK